MSVIKAVRMRAYGGPELLKGEDWSAPLGRADPRY
jgi:hypothetical protein